MLDFEFFSEHFVHKAQYVSLNTIILKILVQIFLFSTQSSPNPRRSLHFSLTKVVRPKTRRYLQTLALGLKLQLLHATLRNSGIGLKSQLLQKSHVKSTERRATDEWKRPLVRLMDAAVYTNMVRKLLFFHKTNKRPQTRSEGTWRVQLNIHIVLTLATRHTRHAPSRDLSPAETQQTGFMDQIQEPSPHRHHTPSCN